MIYNQFRPKMKHRYLIISAGNGGEKEKEIKMKATLIHVKTGKALAEVEIDLAGDVILEGLGIGEDYFGKRHGYLVQDGYRYELTEADYQKAVSALVTP